MRRGAVESCIRDSLNSLRDSSGVDTAFVWLFSADGPPSMKVYAAHGALAQCRVEAWRGATLDTYPWLKGRLDHLRLSEIRDSAAPRKEQLVEGQRLAELQIGSVLMISFRVERRARRLPGARERAAARRLGREPAAAAEAARQLARHRASSSCASRRACTSSKNAWSSRRARPTTACGTSTSRATKSTSRRAGRRCSATRWTRSSIRPTGAASCTRKTCRACRRAIRDHVAGKTPMFESVHRMRHRNGDWRWVVSRAKARVDEHGRLLRLVGVELDITERKLYEEALFREKESAQITLQSIGDGVITTDANSTVDYINPVAEQLTGWRLEDAHGPADRRDLPRLPRRDLRAARESAVGRRSAARGRSSRVRPMLLIRRDGNELYVESTAAPIRDGAGAVSRRRAGVPRRERESRELNRRLSYHASHDLLTGLVNRREFESRARAGAEERQGARELLRAVLPRHRPVQDHQRHLRPLAPATRCSARSARCSSPRCAGATRWRVSAATSSASCSRAARWTKRCARPKRCARRCAISASPGKTACSASAQRRRGADRRGQRRRRLDPVGRRQRLRRRPRKAGRNRVHSFAENDIELMRRRREMQWAARINAALEEGALRAVPHADPAAAAASSPAQHYELLLRMRDESRQASCRRTTSSPPPSAMASRPRSTAG